jgi:hypothetical protein
MPCHAMPCHAMPCHAMPCHAMPCHAMPCHAMPCASAMHTPPTNRLTCGPWASSCTSCTSASRPSTPTPSTGVCVCVCACVCVGGSAAHSGQRTQLPAGPAPPPATLAPTLPADPPGPSEGRPCVTMARPALTSRHLHPRCACRHLCHLQPHPPHREGPCEVPIEHQPRVQELPERAAQQEARGQVRVCVCVRACVCMYRVQGGGERLGDRAWLVCARDLATGSVLRP